MSIAFLASFFANDDLDLANNQLLAAAKGTLETSMTRVHKIIDPNYQFLQNRPIETLPRLRSSTEGSVTGWVQVNYFDSSTCQSSQYSGQFAVGVCIQISTTTFVKYQVVESGNKATITFTNYTDSACSKVLKQVTTIVTEDSCMTPLNDPTRYVTYKYISGPTPAEYNGFTIGYLTLSCGYILV